MAKEIGLIISFSGVMILMIGIGFMLSIHYLSINEFPLAIVNGVIGLLLSVAGYFVLKEGVQEIKK